MSDKKVLGHLAKVAEFSDEWQRDFCRFLSKPFSVDDDGNLELLPEQPTPEESAKFLSMSENLEEARSFMELLGSALPE